MFADQDKARAYIAEVTGLATGRVISSFDNRIEFATVDEPMSVVEMQEIAQRVRKQYPAVETTSLVGQLAYSFKMGHGKVLLLKPQAVALQQVLEASSNLLTAISATWQEIASDAKVSNNAEAIELCLDADRLTINGDEAGEMADKELTELTDMFGAEKVDKHLGEKVRLV